MLLKWLFTMLAIVWLYQALRPFFIVQKPAPPPAPPPPHAASIQKKRGDDDGEYIDYEEIR